MKHSVRAFIVGAEDIDFDGEKEVAEVSFRVDGDKRRDEARICMPIAVAQKLAGKLGESVIITIESETT